MATTQPFRRALVLIQAISAIMQAGLSPLMLQHEVSKLGEYKSRGKGQGKPGKNYFRPYPTDWKARHDALRAKGKIEGVDFGARACQRRLRQMGAAA